MAATFNIARMSSTTTGSGDTIALTGTVTGFKSFAAAGIVNNNNYILCIEEGDNREVGEYTYLAAGPTLTRLQVFASTNSDLAITLAGAAQIFSGPTALLRFSDNDGITDDSGNELLWFQKTASAVNYLEITNAATGLTNANGPAIAAAGSDTDISIILQAKNNADICLKGTSGSGVTQANFVFFTDGSDYAYGQFRFTLQNPDAATPQKQIFSFGAEGTYSDAGALSAQLFYIYDSNASAYRLTVNAGGSVIIGPDAIATTATDGFLYVPTCAGTPTGVPTTVTGRAPIVVNTTNNKLYFYSGGAWRDAGP